MTHTDYDHQLDEEPLSGLSELTKCLQSKHYVPCTASYTCKVLSCGLNDFGFVTTTSEAENVS